MTSKNNHQLASIFTIVVSLSIIFVSCLPSSAVTLAQTNNPMITPSQAPTATVVSMPEITLKKGDFYFSLDGMQKFLLSRNMAGYQPSQYLRLLDLTHTGGSRMVRIQLDSMGTGVTPKGEVDVVWAQKWEQVLDKAASEGIFVIIVFTGWFDWNDGKPDYGFSTWKANSFNSANGGPAATPAELFKADSPTQTMWMAWMKKLVERWQDRENIAAWEIFSEVNLATGPTQFTGTAFVEKAAALIRSADSHQRPTTASLGAGFEWPSFFRSDAVNFINFHPYPPSAKLDRYIISEARRFINTYHKPFLNGESGLSVDPKMATMPNSSRGVSHAIWAGLVSGSMNGRSLYLEDGFAIFYPEMNWPFLESYAKAELPVVNFTDGIDFSGFKPLTATSTSVIWGAAVGNEKMILGWYRDAKCEPPDWNFLPSISGQKVTVTIPGTAAEWKVDFYDTKTGTDIISSANVTRKGNSITVNLPDLSNDIAFKLYPKSSTQ